MEHSSSSSSSGVLETDLIPSLIELFAKNFTAYKLFINRTLFSMRHHHLNRTTTTTTTEPPYEDMAYPDFSQIPAVRIAFVCLFLVEFIICVAGNTLVVLTVYRTKAMHSPVNYYIVNLGICDFLVGAFVLPTKLFELTADAEVNMLNDVWCTVVRYLETIVVFTSVFTLVAICIERYYAVVYPVHSRVYLTYSRIGRILFAVWIIPCLVAAPNIFYPSVATSHHLYSEFGEMTRKSCFDSFSDDFRRGYFIFLFFCMYVIPLLFIGTTCSGIFKALMRPCIAQPHRDPRAVAIEKGRRRVAKMILVVVVAFVICWSPYFIVTVVTQLQTVNFMNEGHFFFTMLCINLLGFANSCVNPLVYFAMSTRFRRGFHNILLSMFCCSKKSPTTSRTSSSSYKRHSQQGIHHTCSGIGNRLHSRSQSSPTPVTANESSGSTRVQSVIVPQHKEPVRMCRRSRTILLNIQCNNDRTRWNNDVDLGARSHSRFSSRTTSPSPEIIPLRSLTNNKCEASGKNFSKIQLLQYEDSHHRAQESFIV